MRQDVRAYVGLGSNLDDPAQQIRRALTALESIPRTRLLRHSRSYRTAPWGITDQPAFVNALAFVLVPLAELDAELAIPGAGVVRDLLACVDAADCVPID